MKFWRNTGWLLILSVMSLQAQEGRTCNCVDAFTDMVEKLEANYIGLPHLLEEVAEQVYQDRVDDYQQKATKTEALNCTRLLNEFLDFFEDGHLFAVEFPKYSDTELVAWKDSIQIFKENEFDPDTVLNQLKQDLFHFGDKILGTYTDGISEIVMLGDGRIFGGFVIKSERADVKPGEIKVELEAYEGGYRGTYFSYTGAQRYTEADLYKDGTLLSIGGTQWLKTDAKAKRELEMVDVAKGINQPVIQKLNEQAVLIAIPSFLVEAKAFNKLIKANHDLLQNAEQLVIDIRGNRGGNGIYFPLFRYFADRKMEGGQGHVLASADNLAYFERNLPYSLAIYQPVVDAIKANMGQIVDGPAYPGRTFRKRRAMQVKQVAILTDEACMSAAESFILHAKKACSYVTTFGSPTAGVIDYTSVNSLALNSGNQNIYFGYPTSTLTKKIPEGGYNEAGIKPDVPIAKEVEDKVAFILDYLKKSK